MLLLKGNLPYKHRKTSIDDMDSNWRKAFEEEVAGDNFLRGGKSILMIGEGAEEESEKWAACLLLANIPTYLTTPIEIIRRLKGAYIPRSNDTRSEEFDQAETLIIKEFFSPETSNMLEEDKFSLFNYVWFLKEAIRDGVVIVIPCDEKDPDLNYLGSEIGDIIEQHFEVINGTKSTAQKSEKKRKR